MSNGLNTKEHKNRGTVNRKKTRRRTKMRQNGQITCTEWIKTRDRRRMRENKGKEAVKQRTQEREERRICRREGGYGGLHVEEQIIGE
jgi:hypothetical protein